MKKTKRLLRLNPVIVYRKKNGVYAFYIDFNYFFFTDKAAELIDQMFEAINSEKHFGFLPDLFLNYLISKKIILEEQS